MSPDGCGDETPIINQVLLKCMESMARWSRFRPDKAAVAYAGMNDLGRIMWIVWFYGIRSVDDLLTAERDRFLSLDAFGRALREMSNDIEFAFSEYNESVRSQHSRLRVIPEAIR